MRPAALIGSIGATQSLASSDAVSSCRIGSWVVGSDFLALRPVPLRVTRAPQPATAYHSETFGE